MRLLQHTWLPERRAAIGMPEMKKCMPAPQADLHLDLQTRLIEFSVPLPVVRDYHHLFAILPDAITCGFQCIDRIWNSICAVGIQSIALRRFQLQFAR